MHSDLFQSVYEKQNRGNFRSDKRLSGISIRGSVVTSEAPVYSYPGWLKIGAVMISSQSTTCIPVNIDNMAYECEIVSSTNCNEFC